MTTSPDTPPEMAAWNLALRFVLEIGALTGMVLAAWELSPGGLKWIAAIMVPVIAATAWGMFNVAGDPSRSGEAPIAVSGWVRLVIEIAILGIGGASYVAVNNPLIAMVFAVLLIVHYAASASRVRWMLIR